MIRITVELVPHGIDDEHTKIIGMGFIANTGTGTKEKGNYTAAFWVEEQGEKVAVGDTTFEGFDRKENVWKLVQAALENL